MKRVYEPLQIDVIAFDKKDVISASSKADGDNTYGNVFSFMSISDFFRS